MWRLIVQVPTWVPGWGLVENPGLIRELHGSTGNPFTDRTLSGGDNCFEGVRMQVTDPKKFVNPGLRLNYVIRLINLPRF
jgi:hypothetical protein